MISGVTGDPADAIIITAILALSVGLGFVNDYPPKADAGELILVAMVLAYLALVVVVKSRFYARELGRMQAVPATTHEQRLSRRIRRRAGLFVRHEFAHLR